MSHFLTQYGGERESRREKGKQNVTSLCCNVADKDASRMFSLVLFAFFKKIFGEQRCFYSFNITNYLSFCNYFHHFLNTHFCFILTFCAQFFF